jgi:hypothetical protein
MNLYRILGIAFFTSALMTSGCGSAKTPYAEMGYMMNDALSVTVGSPMMSWEVGERNAHLKIHGSRYELIYSGIAHDVVQVAYREYFINQVVGQAPMIRSAFGQNLQYDITQSRTITFQDIRIEVIAADQEKIDYRILTEPDAVIRTRVTMTEKAVARAKDRADSRARGGRPSAR